MKELASRAANRYSKRRAVLALTCFALAVAALMLRTVAIRPRVPAAIAAEENGELVSSRISAESSPSVSGTRVDVPSVSLPVTRSGDEMRSWTVINRLNRRPIGGAYLFETDEFRRSASAELVVATSEHKTGKLEVVWTDHLARGGLVVVAEGYLPAMLSGKSLAGIQIIELEPGATYRAKFSTVDGAPAKGVRVRMSQARLDHRFATRSNGACLLPAAAPDIAVYDGISDQDGLLSITGLQAGEYWATLESDRYVGTQVPGMRKISVVQNDDIEQIELAYVGVIAIAKNDEIVSLDWNEQGVEGRLNVRDLRGGLTRTMLAREIFPRIVAPKHAVRIEALRDDPDVVVREMELRVQLADREPYKALLRFQSPRTLNPYVLTPPGPPLKAPRHACVQFAAVGLDQSLIPENLVIAFLESHGASERPQRRPVYNGETAYIEPGRYTVTYSAGLAGRIPDAEFTCSAGETIKLTASLSSPYAIVEVAFRSALEDLPLGCDLTIQYGNGETADVHLSSSGKLLIPAGEAIVLSAQRRLIELARMSCLPQPGQIVTFEVPISERR